MAYMPGAVAPSFPNHDDGTGADDTEDPTLPENTPLTLPSAVEPMRRNTICLHRVAEYEGQLRLAQVQDSLIELRTARQIKHSLMVNHRTQIAGQGTRVNTRSRTTVDTAEEHITKFAQRYRAAYDALLRLDPTGTWRETYLELKNEDNRGPWKEADERGPGDGSYTLSWIWLLNPRARDLGEVNRASDEEVNDMMRVQWTTSQARLERWTEEVELLQAEMRRVVTFLEWKARDWWAKQDVRSATTSPSIQSGLKAYARKQATIYHDLTVSFLSLWFPALDKSHLESSWVAEFLKQHESSLSDPDIPTERSETGVTGTTDGSSSHVGAAPCVQHQHSSEALTNDNATLLKEFVYDGDTDSDSDDGSDVTRSSDSDSGDDDFDFDLGWN